MLGLGQGIDRPARGDLPEKRYAVFHGLVRDHADTAMLPSHGLDEPGLNQRLNLFVE
jgi:hypothetical protein